MKKFITILLSVVMVLSMSFTSMANVLENNEKSSQIIKEFTEIKDKDELYKRAKEGISDLKDEEKIKKVKSKATIKNIKTNDEENLEVINTTQLLNVIKENDKIKKTYATTSFAILSRNDYGYSGAYDIKATSTIYWEEIDVNGAPCVNLTRATGYWEILTSNISIWNGVVQCTQNGQKSSNGVLDTQTIYYHPYNCDPFDYSSFNFIPVGAHFYVLGAKMSCSYTRGGSSYLFEFSNAVEVDSM